MAMLFSERRKVTSLAEEWCNRNDLSLYPFNIITALDALGYLRNEPVEKEVNMPVSTDDFDTVHNIGKRLKDVFHRDGFTKAEGMEDYIVRAVEEAKRLTKLAPDVCLVCHGKGKVNVLGAVVPCRECVGTGKRQ